MEKDTVKDDCEDFKLCLEAESKQRKVSQNDLEFAKLGEQWDQRDIEQRREEGRPCLTINRLPSFAKQVLNDGRMNGPSINVKPVGGGATKETADIQSDLIRNIETLSQAPIVYETAFDFAVYCGIGYFRVDVDYTHDDEWDQDIILRRINNPFSVYGDYESKEATSIDWNRAYVTDWYSKSSFEAKWGKDRKATSFETGNTSYDRDWFEDKRIRVAERWYREEVEADLLKLSNGSVMYAPEYEKIKPALEMEPVPVTVLGTRKTKTFKVGQRIITGCDVLEENEWMGKYIPIVPMYGEEANVNGKRHFISLIRRAKDAQRMLNYWRSASTELVALAPKAPWIGAVGQFSTDANKWTTANRVSHAYIEYDPDVQGAYGPPQRQPFAGVPAGALQEALNASDDMKSIIGIYDASLGARSNETSGKAIMARDRQGDVGTFDFIDNRNRAVEHGGRIVLDLIPKIYSVERVLRCIQEDGATYTVPVNQPVAPKADFDQVMQAPEQMPMQAQNQMPELDQQQAPQNAGGPPDYVPMPAQEQMQALPPEKQAKLKAITKIFDLTTGKYDVTVTAGPGFSTRREESASQMMEFIRIYPAAAPFIGDLLAKNLDWPGSEQVAERLKAMLPPQAMGAINPMVAQLQQLVQQKDQQAMEAVNQLQAQIAEMDKALKDKSAENSIKMLDSQTKRMQEVANAAEKGIAVVPNPQNPNAMMTGDYVAVPAVPVMPQSSEPPTPVDPLHDMELGLRHREYDIKGREMDLKQRDLEGKLAAENVELAERQMANVDVPAMIMAQQQQFEQFAQLMIATMQSIAQNMAPKPVRKQATAVRDPATGAYRLESVEIPIDAAVVDSPEAMQ